MLTRFALPAKLAYPLPRGHVFLLTCMDDCEQAKEFDCHQTHALAFAHKVRAWGQQHQQPLGVQCFLMDLRGDVELLTPDSQTSPPRKRPRKPKSV